MSNAEQGYEKAVYTTAMKQGMTGIHSTLVNDNYVNKYESSISAVETQYVQSRYSASLNAPAFGSTSQAYLPTQALIGETYLLLQLREASDPTSTYALPDGWGLRCIQSINYTMPSDSIGQITITNDELYHYLYCQERDYTSTTELLKLMGTSIPYGPGPVFGSSPPTSLGDDSAPNWYASILLPLPWCSLGYDTKPLDSTIFGSGQIFINIIFAPPSQVYQRLSGTGSLTFASATLTYRQGEMTNKENSLKYLMLRNPSLVYDMPYIRSQYKSIGNLTLGSGINGGVGSFTTNQAFVSGLLNSDLVGMCISAHRIPQPGVVGNAYLAVNLYNVSVVFAGLVLYKSDGYSHRLYNYQGAQSAGYDCTDIYTNTSKACFPHIINFSRLRSMNWNDHYFNVMKFNAQTFNINAGIPDSAMVADSNFQAGVELRVTMFYNAVMELGQYRTQQRLL